MYRPRVTKKTGVRSRLRPTATAVDGATAVLLALTVVLAATSGNVGALAVVAALVVSAAVTVRRRHPELAILIVGAGATVCDHVRGGNLPVLPVAFVLSYFSLGRRSAERGWSLIDVVFLAMPVVAIALDPNTPSPDNPLIVDVVSVWAFFVAFPFFAGRVAGTRTKLITALRANTDRLAEEQRHRERQAATDERTRIARELHDVIAHSVSVMVIQTSAARRVAGRDPEAAVEAVRAVERCGRDALLDLRRMIGVLRRDEVGLVGDIAPGVAQLDRLADRARSAGMPVRICVRGEPRRLPPALDLVIYRVAQEALTNAMKHAGPAQARIVVTFGADELELEIVDTGDGSAPDPIDSGGQGLIGMRERLALYGGQLQAGLRPAGGFRVHARIPLIGVMPA